ncbi:hypothetical protein ACOMHN_062017 [Nucella lapillus]
MNMPNMHQKVLHVATFREMPLKFLHSGPKWPKGYGFEIYGNGPTYVVSVQAVSSASQAGLSPGDQLLEVDGQDVTNMAASAIKVLAKHSRMQPPALEVVACVTRLVLEPQGFSGYGFAVLNNRPVVVGSVEFGGPAFEAGLRVGDVILEVNGKRAEKVETVGSVLSQRSGQLSMLTIPVGRSGQLLHVDKGLSHLPPSDPRVHRAKDLYDKLGEVLGEDYERKMMVVAILKQYAEDRDIEILCRSLYALLHTPRSRSILRHIRRYEHDKLIELLQDSGSTPTLEILRCQAGQLPVLLTQQKCRASSGRWPRGGLTLVAPCGLLALRLRRNRPVCGGDGRVEMSGVGAAELASRRG